MKRILGTVVVIFSLAACGGSGGGIAGADGGVTGTNSGTVNGRVATSSSAQNGQIGPDVASASVATVLQIQSNGSLTAVSNPTAVNSDGTYSVAVLFNASSVSDLVVQIASTITDGGTAEGAITSEALISSTLQPGGTVTAPPTNAQTTVQADTSIGIHATMDWNANSNDAQVDALIDAQTAATIAASTTYATDISSAANAAQAGMNARAAMFLSGTVGVTQTQLTSYLAAEESAQVQEDIALNAATSQAQITAAQQARATAEAQAATTAGISLSQQSRAAVAQAHAQVAGVVVTPAATSTTVVAETVRFESQEAASVEAADQAEFLALSASGSVQSDIANAQSTLNSSIAASAGSAVTIQAAWAAYDATLKADLITTLEADHAGATASVNSVISAEATALTTLNTAVTAAGANGTTLAAAYATYQTSLTAAVQADAVLSTFSAAQISAAVNVMLDMQTAG